MRLLPSILVVALALFFTASAQAFGPSPPDWRL